MRFTVLDDPASWGRRVADEARRRGHTRDDLHADVGFVRLLTYEPWRTRGLAMIERLSRRGVACLPGALEASWYDDKIAQAAILANWLPQTRVIRPGDPIPEMAFPFVSKAHTGAQSRNVRLVRTPEEAAREVELAFGPGIPIKPKGVQKGYLYWQDFVPGNAFDIRVIIAGEHLFGLRRFNRPDVPFASGSGHSEPIRPSDDARVRQCFEATIAISDALGTRWQAYDFVFGDRLYCLEMAASWVDKVYVDCPCFDRNLEPDGHYAREWCAFAVDEMERLLGLR